MNLYDFNVLNQEGKDVSLSEYKGKVLLIVNTATECGLTKQYDEIQKLYDKYQDQGFEVLDFPCNQFLGQAPGSSEEINSFCSLNFGTSFTRFDKVEVNGENEHKLFTWLKEQKPVAVKSDAAIEFEELVKQYTPDIKDTDIKWNFGKFLIDKDGNVVQRYSPALELNIIEDDIKELI